MRQYTIRNIPPRLDRALRRTAQDQHKSLNQVALEALERGAGLSDEARPRHRDLSELSGADRKDPRVEEALEDQRRIDPEMWGRGESE